MNDNLNQYLDSISIQFTLPKLCFSEIVQPYQIQLRSNVYFVSCSYFQYANYHDREYECARRACNTM